MMNPRYAALSLIALAMLLAGFAAIALPDPFRGPLIVAHPPAGVMRLGLAFLPQPVYLADALGLALLVLAMLAVWVIAITWEYRRHH